jgi:hypothetical protein
MMTTDSVEQLASETERFEGGSQKITEAVLAGTVKAAKRRSGQAARLWQLQHES